MRFANIEIEGLDIFYREAGQPGAPKLVLLHGFPSSSHQYRNLIPALAERFHVIAPDYPGFGNSAMPDPAKFGYTFDRISTIVESFLAKVGFTRFGLYVQDYGGPVGFRIVTRRPGVAGVAHHPEQQRLRGRLHVGLGWPAGRYWKNRTPEAERSLEAFLQPETIKQIYLHGHRRPELVSPDNWNMDVHLLERPNARRRAPGSLLRLPHQREALSPVAGAPAQAAAEDPHLLGTERHLLHPRGRRGLPPGPAPGGDASPRFRSLRRRGQPRRHREGDDRFSPEEGALGPHRGDTIESA